MRQRRTVPKSLRSRLRAKNQKDVARKLQARKDEFDSKEGPNDEPQIEDVPEPESTESIAEERPEPEKTPVDPGFKREVDESSAGKTAAQTKRKKLSRTEVAAATKFAVSQLKKAGISTKGNDAQVQARFREANHAEAVKRQVEGKQRAKSIGASSALGAAGANSKAQLTAQAKARVAATKASASAKTKVASTVSAAKAKATAAVRAKVVTQTNGNVPTNVRVPAPAPAKPAAKKPAPPKKPPVKKVGGGRHII